MLPKGTLRIIIQFARNALAVILLLSVTLNYTVFMTTPKGIHCPTAAVQKIQDYSTHQLRTPEAGEKEFKQCQCAEASNLKKQSSQEQATFASLPTLNMPTYLGSAFGIPLFPDFQAVDSQLSLPIDPISQPATPPPNFI